MTEDMYNLSVKDLIIPIVALVGFLALAYVFLVLFALGPRGWVLLGILVIAFTVAYKSWRGDGSGLDPERVSCPNCGSRNQAGTTTCEYCGADIG